MWTQDGSVDEFHNSGMRLAFSGDARRGAGMEYRYLTTRHWDGAGPAWLGGPVRRVNSSYAEWAGACTDSDDNALVERPKRSMVCTRLN